MSIGITSIARIIQIIQDLTSRLSTPRNFPPNVTKINCITNIESITIIKFLFLLIPSNTFILPVLALKPLNVIAITNVAKAAIGALNTVPNIAGSVLNAVVAGFFVGAIGESVVALSEAIYLGKIDKSKIDNVVDFISDKLKNNAVLAFAVNYIEKNAEKLQGKSAKEIFSIIDKAVKDGIKVVKK